MANMNRDGIFTISDVGAWIGWLFFYPGDLVIYGILSIEQLARFFEVTPAHYGGLFSFLFGLAIWPIPLLVLFIGRVEEETHKERYSSNQKTVKEALERVQDRLVKVDVAVGDLRLMVDRTSSDVRSLIHVSET